MYITPHCIAVQCSAVSAFSGCFGLAVPTQPVAAEQPVGREQSSLQQLLVLQVNCDDQQFAVGNDYQNLF